MARRFSLKQKIVYTTVLSGIVGGLILGLVVFLYLKDVLVQEKLQEIHKLSIEQSHETRAILEKNKLFAKMLSENIVAKEFLLDQSVNNRQAVENVLFSYAKEDPKYLAIYLVDKNGLTVVSTDPRFVGQDYTFRDYYKKGIDGQPWVEVLLGKVTNQVGYFFSHPVYDNGNIIGVLVVKTSTDEIDRSVINSEIDKTGTIMLTDQYGVIIYSSREGRLLNSLGQLSATEMSQLDVSDKFLDHKIEPLQYNIAQNIIRNYTKEQTVQFNDKEDNDQEVISLVKLGDFPFYLVTESPLDKVEGTVLSTIIFLLAIIFILMSGFVIIVYRLVVIFISPLEKLKSFAQAISLGDFSKTIEIKSTDEFSNLAETLNKMAKDLSDLYANLDTKVKDKTLEIEDKNEDLDKQKMALLNVLEDVEEEKNKTISLAKDLEKFKLAVDNASDHVVITDGDGVILYANKAVELITGFSMSEVVGKKAGSRDLWGGQMPLDFYQQMWKTIKNDKKIFSGRIRNKRKNGKIYEAMSSISPIIDDHGVVQFFVGIERDVTKEAEIDRAKTEFVSLASHQLRTPLSAINWYVEMLLNGDAGKLKSTQIEYLKEIFDGNQRMIDLVNALLNVSRIEMGTLAVESVPTDLRELADNVLNELKPQWSAKKQKISKVYDKNLPMINLDNKIMRVVWQNFLSNAVKYTPEKGNISVGIAVKGKDALISVADTGYGIPKSQQDKIFTKLFRADNIRDKVTDGTGLGLYIIKSVIEQFGGKVWFESVENKGTTFYATIPLKGVAKKEGSKGLNYNK